MEAFVHVTPVEAFVGVTSLDAFVGGTSLEAFVGVNAVEDFVCPWKLSSKLPWKLWCNLLLRKLW